MTRRQTPEPISPELAEAIERVEMAALGRLSDEQISSLAENIAWGGMSTYDLFCAIDALADPEDCDLLIDPPAGDLNPDEEDA